MIMLASKLLTSLTITLTINLTINKPWQDAAGEEQEAACSSETGEDKGTDNPQREISLLTTYCSGSTDVFGGPASRHGSLNSLFQVALYLPS